MRSTHAENQLASVLTGGAQAGRAQMTVAVYFCPMCWPMRKAERALWLGSPVPTYPASLLSSCLCSHSGYHLPDSVSMSGKTSRALGREASAGPACWKWHVGSDWQRGEGRSIVPSKSLSPVRGRGFQPSSKKHQESSLL